MTKKPSFQLDDSFTVVETALLPTSFKEELGLEVGRKPKKLFLSILKETGFSSSDLKDVSLNGWNFKFAAQKQNGYLSIQVDLASNKKNIKPVNRYQLLVEAANDIIFEIDSEGFFTYLNPAALKISGYKKKEILGKVFLKVIRPDWRARTVEFYMNQMSNSIASTYFEFPGITATGEEIWIAQKVQLLEDEKGIIGLMAVGRDITEFKLADEALRRSEEKYRGIIQNLEAGLMEVDTDEKIQYVNKAMAEIVGYSIEDMMGNNASDLLLDVESRKVIDEEHKKRDEGSGSVYEVKLTHKNGNPLWTLISAAPVFGVDGKRTGSIGIHLDVTESKKNLKELEFTKNRLSKYKEGLELINEITSNTELSYQEQLSQGLITAASYLELPVGIISSIENNEYKIEDYFLKEDNGSLSKGLIFDFKKTYCEMVYTHETYIAIDHFTKSKHSGHPCYDLFKLETYIGAPYYVNGEKRGTVNFSAPNPREIHFDSFDTEFINLLSKWVGSIFNQMETQDTLASERKALGQRNEELFRQRNFLNAINKFVTKLLDKDDLEELAWEIAENVIDNFGFEDCVIYLLDEEARVLNPVAVFGAKRGKKREILNPIQIPVGEGIVGAVAAKGIPELVNDTSKDKRYIVDDARRYSELAVPIIADNKVLGVIDSEHHKKNFFSSEDQGTLTTVANLAATRLKIAKSKAKERELNELKSRFIAMASHEFRTPLTTIKQNAGLVAHKLEKEIPESYNNYDKFLKRIDSEIGRVTLLMNDILTLGRIESGRIEITKQPVDILALCEGVIRHRGQNWLDGRKVGLTVKGTVRQVEIDEHLFDHIITNLMSNALKYSVGKPDPEITLNFEDDRQLSLSVKDYGIGIPEKDQKGLFESFYRATNVKNIQGSGLGLSIVKEFVEMHEGNIEVISQSNQGCEVIVKMPY